VAILQQIRRKWWRKWWIRPDKVSVHTSKGSHTSCKILQHGTTIFTSLPKRHAVDFYGPNKLHERILVTSVLYWDHCHAHTHLSLPISYLTFCQVPWTLILYLMIHSSTIYAIQKKENCLNVLFLAPRVTRLNKQASNLFTATYPLL
jgi:hypothetical protein